MKPKEILKQDIKIRVNGSLWIEASGHHFFGPGPVELLELISDTGSIRLAAKQMGMSYKKAWTLINSLNEQCQKPIVIPKTGGEKGGGSTVTPEALELIKYHREMRKRFAEFLEKETGKLTT